MENRGTGLTPQRAPGWERKPLELGKQVVQGPSKDQMPTSRDATQTHVETAGGYMGAMLRTRPGVAFGESRAQAPLPTEVIDVLAQGGGFIAQTVAGGSFEAQKEIPPKLATDLPSTGAI